MQQGSRQILFLGMCVGITSVLYFFSLMVQAHFVITGVIALAACISVYRWLFRPAAGYEVEYLRGLPLLILVTAVTILTLDASKMALKYGQWDAWAMWNLHAKYLANAEHWQQLFLNTKFNHPDYPLFVPANNAFFSKLFTGQYSTVVPFAFSFLACVSIPVLLYTETYKRSIFFATIFLLYFAYNDHYLANGIAQYADTWVGFFLLAAVIALENSTKDKRYMAVAAALLGCCIWTKNEGLILAVLCVLFYFKRFADRRTLLYSIIGFALPVAAYLMLKLAYAPNMDDRLMAVNAGTLQYFLEPERWAMVYDYFVKNLNEHFYWAKIIFIALFIIMMLKREKPTKVLLLVFACMLAYTLVYIALPKDLEWHLQTSQDRLMHQLLPLFFYAVTIQLTQRKLVIIRRMPQQ